jgi:hypothetical protein
MASSKDGRPSFVIVVDTSQTTKSNRSINWLLITFLEALGAFLGAIIIM